jgi:hypothetical protein
MREIRLLRWHQIDFEKKYITVGKAKTAAGKGRGIPFALMLESLISSYLGRHCRGRDVGYNEHMSRAMLERYGIRKASKVEAMRAVERILSRVWSPKVFPKVDDRQPSEPLALTERARSSVG